MVEKIVYSRRSRILSSLMHSHTQAPSHDNNFKLKSSKEFASRSANVFEELKTLETQYDTHTFDVGDEASVKVEDTSEISSDVFKRPSDLDTSEISSDVFKRPSNPVSRKRKFSNIGPRGYRISPHKYIKYSLADTPDMSEEANKKAALQFLSELRDKKIREENACQASEEKIMFHKHESKDLGETSKPTPFSKSSFIDTKYVMPDCVIGKTKSSALSKQKKIKLDKNKILPNVNLEHLNENLDEDE